jgi:thiol:disulfide interchange protein DsbC
MLFSRKLWAPAILLAGLAGCQSGEQAAEANKEVAEGDSAQVVASKVEGAVVAPGEEAITARLSEVFARSGVKVVNVSESAMPGIYQVELDNLRFVYSTADAGHIIAGDLYSTSKGKMDNLSEQERTGSRAKLLATVAEKDMIIFSPKADVKGRISVFTDVDCYYCQKLHHDMDQLNALGIEVRYLAYPRAGIGSPSYQKIASAWCADDRNASMTMLKNKQNIPMNVCDGNPVAAQFALGRKIGVNGTPALVLDDGRLLPGYLPPDRMAKELGIN